MTKELDNIINDQESHAANIQKTIHAFIKADILHRRVIEQWATDAGMHRSQHRMLMYLTKCGDTPTQKDIAKNFDISPAAVAVTLKKLESDGYIERVKCADRSDSRFNEIKITDRGRNAAMQSRIYFQHVDCEAFKDFTDEELDLFSALLERMQANLKNVAPINEATGEKAIPTRKETE